MTFARVNGIVLHYEDRGSPDMPAIAFSNALGTDFRIWDSVVSRLEDRYRIVRYDKRGHGLSDAPPAPYRMTDHVDDLAGLLGHLGITNTAVVGLSVGGMIAQGLAALRPDLVAAIVLCDTAHRIGTEDIWNERIDTVKARGIAALADATMQRWFTPGFRTPGNPDLSGYVNMLVRTPVDGYTGTCAALRDADLTESTKALKLPVLLVAGDQDGSTPPDLVRSTAALIAGSRFEIIRDAGHLPCIEQPDVTARLIGDFLAGAGHG